MTALRRAVLSFALVLAVAPLLAAGPPAFILRGGRMFGGRIGYQPPVQAQLQGARGSAVASAGQIPGESLACFEVPCSQAAGVCTSETPVGAPPARPSTVNVAAALPTLAPLAAAAMPDVPRDRAATGNVARCEPRLRRDGSGTSAVPGEPTQEVPVGSCRDQSDPPMTFSSNQFPVEI